MTQLAAPDTAESARAYVRAKTAERGLAPDVEAEAQRLFAEAMREAARHIPPQSWNDLYCRGYEYAANKRHLARNRLYQFAHAYADIAAPMAHPIPVECFWLGWEAGIYEADENGTWRERAVLTEDGTDYAYYGARWPA